jgi:ADP-ribose pyrophosphatase
MAPEKWKTQSSTEVYKNAWIRVREDVAELPNGRTTIYGVVEMKNGAVGVLPFVDADHVVLVRQYRYVFDEADRWEIPTGGAKPGELLEEAAQRELQEEIGYTAGRLEWVSTLYTSKSVVHEVAHLYIGTALHRAALPPDDTEELEQAVFSFAEVLAMVNRGEIRDAMTIIAVLHAAQRRALGAP